MTAANMNTSKTHQKQIALALSLLSLIAFIGELITPTEDRPQGRWSFLFGMIWDHGGSPGLALYWAAVSLIFCITFFALKKDAK